MQLSQFMQNAQPNGKFIQVAAGHPQDFDLRCRWKICFNPTQNFELFTVTKLFLIQDMFIILLIKYEKNHR